MCLGMIISDFDGLSMGATGNMGTSTKAAEAAGGRG